MTSVNAEPSPTPGDAAARQSPWRNRNFRRFWAAVTTSGFGGQVTMLALPLTAVTTLGANAAQLGVLSGALLVPSLVLTPVSGVISDHFPGRLVNSVADVGRGVALLAIPLLALIGHLSFGLLLVVSVAAGCFKALADVAHYSMLPSVVPTEQLTRGNAAISSGSAVAEGAGPGFAGVLIQVVTAPYALVLDSLSLLTSGLLLARTKTPYEVRSTVRQGFFKMMRDGFGYLFRHRILLTLGISGGVSNFLFGAYEAIEVYFLATRLGLQPSVVGMVYLFGAVGGFAGALLAERVGVRLKLTGAITAGRLVAGVGILVMAAVVPFGGSVRIGVAIAATFAYSLGLGVVNVHSISVRQGICPPEFLGRVNAGYRLLSRGSLPLGAFVGGYCAQAFGVVSTIACVGVGMLVVATVLVLFTPFRHLDRALEGSVS